VAGVNLKGHLGGKPVRGSFTNDLGAKNQEGNTGKLGKGEETKRASCQRFGGGNGTWESIFRGRSFSVKLVKGEKKILKKGGEKENLSTEMSNKREL